MRLRAGDWVEVRSVDEILATLDRDGSLAGLPFMPEMLQYAGKRFRVYKSAHKTCDTIDQYVIRRMDETVHLEGLRCDGQAHGGCQAECLLFWKEAWLKPVDGGLQPGDGHAERPGSPVSEAQLAGLQATTRQTPAPGDAEDRYRCQATELLKATSEVRRRDRWDPTLLRERPDLRKRHAPPVCYLRPHRHHERPLTPPHGTSKVSGGVWFGRTEDAGVGARPASRRNGARAIQDRDHADAERRHAKPGLVVRCRNGSTLWLPAACSAPGRDDCR